MWWRASWLIGAVVVAAVVAGSLIVLRGGEATPAATQPPARELQRAVDPNVRVLGGIVRQGAPATPTPTRTPTATATPTQTATPTATPTATATPTHEGPASPLEARVWSNGDSTSYFMSVWLLDYMTDRGAYQTQPEAEYQVSSGLANSWFFDWYAYFASEMALRTPNVVVFMIGANDAAANVDLTQYHQLVGQAMDQLRAPGRRVVWVGQPAMGRADLAPRIQPMNQVFREEAALRPWVSFVDVFPMTSDGFGNFTPWMINEYGQSVLGRTDDGVHFTGEGGRLLALEVMRRLYAALNWPNAPLVNAEAEAGLLAPN